MPGWLRRGGLVLTLGVVSGCTVRDAACALVSRTDAGSQEAPEQMASTGPVPSSTGAFKITFLGDSLTVGIGLRTDDAYPTLVQRQFTAQGYRVEVVNASINAASTADGLRQLPAVLEPDLRILVVALGGNDAFRGVAIAETRENLVSLIGAARAGGAAVLLVGMEPPTNLGDDYRLAFRGIFQRLASDYGDSISFLPSLLEGVAGNPALNQQEGGRPNADGAKVIAQRMFGKLQVMVDAMGGGG